MSLGKAVRDHRTNLMRELMDREGYDALAFTGTPFAQFATNFNYDYWPWERPLLVVVPRNGEPFAIFPWIVSNQWRYAVETERVWIDDARFYAEYPQVRERMPHQSQWSEFVADRLREAGLHRSRIGVEAITAPLIRASGLLPQLSLEAAGTECSKLVSVKHPEEVAAMRDAAAIADWIQDRYKENIRPGRLVQELDLSMFALGAEEAARRIPGEDYEWWFKALSGPVSCATAGDGRNAGARIKKGDGIVNQVCVRVNGMWIENERTWFCGKPSARQVKLYDAALAANESGCAAAIAGNPVCSIDAAAQSVFERAGVSDLMLHRTGHGIGIEMHEYPVDMAFNTSKLQAGQVVTVEPAIFEWGLGGFRVDDTVVVGDVPEVLTKSSKDLASQIID